jgi:NAD(P)-dependent dehydrogenase (short-subunit alcohol dehydrogenase family)
MWHQCITPPARRWSLSPDSWVHSWHLRLAECDDAAGRQGAGWAVQVDVTCEEQVRRLANLVVAHYESVDVVVCSAGVAALGRLVDTPLQVSPLPCG